MRKKILVWLTGTRFWDWLLIRILPFIRFSMYYTRFKGDKFVEAYRILTPGQFLLCVDEKKATTFLVPGFMTHAAFCVNNCLYSNDTNYEVAEMTHHNFTKSFFFEICKESSRILICDCLDWTLDHRMRMIQACPSLYDSTYDIQFQFGVKSLYCSELIYQLDRMASNPKATDEELAEGKLKGKMKVDLSDFAGLGRDYISPDGLLFAPNTRVVWDSDGELTGLLGRDAEVLCKVRGYIK